MTADFDPTPIAYRWSVIAIALATALTIFLTEWDPAEILATVIGSGFFGLVFGILLAWRLVHRYAKHRAADVPRDHSHCTIVYPIEYIRPRPFRPVRVTGTPEGR